MHLAFKTFTLTLIVIWCQVKCSHSKSKDKSTEDESISQKILSLLTDSVETSSISSYRTNKESIHNTLSDGTQKPSSTILKIIPETTSNQGNDKTSDKVKSKNKHHAGATSMANATKSPLSFRPRMRYRHARFRFNGTRLGNSTVIRQRLLRKGFGPHWRTLDNGTRVRVSGRLRKRRGGNMTLTMRAQRIKRLRKQHTTSTEKPLRGTGLFDTIDESFSDNELKKKQKHHTSSTKKITRDGSVFSDLDGIQDIVLSDTKHVKKRKYHKGNTHHTSDKEEAIKNSLDLADDNTKDLTPSDAEHMEFLKDQKSSTQKAVNDNYAFSDRDRNNEISLSENEHKEITRHHVPSTKKHLRITPATQKTTSKKDDDFSYSESDETTKITTTQKTRTYRWPKTKEKQIGRTGKKYGRTQAHGNRETNEKRKINQNEHGTETTKHKMTTKADLGGWFKPYTIKAHLNALKCKFNNVNMTVEVIGRTMSYYDIVMLRASAKRNSYNDDDVYFRGRENKFADDGPEKRIVFIVHGLSVMGIHDLRCMLEVKEFEKLLSYYFAHLDKFDIFLIPMANPDGVAVPNGKHDGIISHNWNKNTSPQTECPGVALDRNFDIMWNIRRNLSSCNQQYPGPFPFSENETRAIRSVLHRYSQRIVAYLNVHAGTYTSKIFKGDAVLYPKGYTDVQTEDDKYIDLRGEIDEVLKNASFQVYTVSVDTLYNWYGKVGGTSVDYAASVYGIPYSMELVMQLYEFTPRSNDEEQEQEAVLHTSWRRIINVIFNSVHRYVNNTGV